MLPWQLSQDGPGVAWVNLLGDGREELVIGSGRGGNLGVYFPDGKGGLVHAQSKSTLPEDLTGIVGWVPGPNGRALVVGRDNYETPGNPPSASVFGYVPTPQNQDLPATPASTGPLAVADIYGNGKLDLFVGGRVIPGRYPEAADSRIYRNVEGKLVLDEENSRVLEKAGLVNGAVWSDLDGDGYPDLILACEWGPIRVFKNEHGHLHEITKELGLDRYTGLWHGVTTGDMDGDGRLDIIASNWGENSDYQAGSNQPLRMYYADFSDRGALDLIEGVYDPVRGVEVPRRMRDALAKVYPPLLGRFPTHKSYAEATMEQILALLPKPAEKVEARTLASMVFFNRTNHFEGVELPYEAQIAPAFAVNVGDFDGDGNEDVFLSQNFSELASSAAAMSVRVEDAADDWTRGGDYGCAGTVAASSRRFRARNPASWFMASSAERRCATLTATGVWIWRSARTGRRSSSIRMSWASRACGCGWRGRRAIPMVWAQHYGWCLGAGRERRGRSTAVRATGRRTARCRSWAARKPDTDLGPLARRQDHHERHSGWCKGNHGGYGWQYNNKSLMRK